MIAMNFGRHISGQFNVELESIRTHVLTMGDWLNSNFHLRCKLCTKKMLSLREKLCEMITKLAAMEVSIDEACTRIIAKRQPTAKDLRLIMAIIKTITDLERIGDVATRMAYVAIEKSIIERAPFQISLEPLCRQAIAMLHQALDAFARAWMSSRLLRCINWMIKLMLNTKL